MPDFTSALYLGLHHPSRALRPWPQLTTGAPAALRRVPGAARGAARLAALQGCEAGVLAPSTLHAAWDVGGMVDPGRDELHVDAGTYPVLRCAAVRARARGGAVLDFPHHDARALARAVAGRRRRPVVLVDGLCPSCGAPAPLREYLRVVRRRGGLLVVDDTQAVGILGARSPGAGPWGAGGGGSVPFHALADAAPLLLVVSLAKGLGVPAAAVSGSRAVVGRYLGAADTRTHGSPVSAADVAALEHALDAHATHGEVLRRRLAALVARFRNGLRALGVAVGGLPFPVLGLPPMPPQQAGRLHRSLLAAGVRTVVVAGGHGSGRIVFLLTARHTDADVDAALAAIAAAPARIMERAA